MQQEQALTELFREAKLINNQKLRKPKQRAITLDGEERNFDPNDGQPNELESPLYKKISLMAQF